MRKCQPHPARWCAGSGLTLVELLAALVILSLVTMVSWGAAAGLGVPHRHMAAESALRAALQRARLVAKASGGAELGLGRWLTIMPDSGAAGAGFAPTSLPPGWTVRTVPERGTVRFGADGTSLDTTLILDGPEEHQTAFALAGLSGELVPASKSTRERTVP